MKIDEEMAELAFSQSFFCFERLEAPSSLLSRIVLTNTSVVIFSFDI